MSNNKYSNMIFGIDIGKYHICCVGIDSETGVVKKYTNKQGVPFLSLVAINNETGHIMYGQKAQNNLHTFNSEWSIIPSIKDELVRDHKWKIGNDLWTVVDILEKVLLRLKKNVAKISSGAELSEAVFTIPSHLPAKARSKIRQAAERSGIVVRCFVKESVAAYFYKYKTLGSFNKVVVLDWGSGAFRASVLHNDNTGIIEDIHKQLAFGGRDIDMRLARFVHEDLVRSGNETIKFEEVNTFSREQLLYHCENTKRQLLRRPVAELSLTHYGNTIGLRRHIGQEVLENLIEPHIDNVLDFIEKVIEEASLCKHEIGCVLITGGSSRVALLKRALDKQWANKVYYYDKEAEWGSAIGAALLLNENITYYIAESLNVLLSDGTLYPIIDANTNIETIDHTYAFGLIEDSKIASFIFCNNKKELMGHVDVPTDGFLQEKINLQIKSDNNGTIGVQVYGDNRDITESVDWSCASIKLRYCLN